jgi:hypothetical protein
VLINRRGVRQGHGTMNVWWRACTCFPAPNVMALINFFINRQAVARSCRAPPLPRRGGRSYPRLGSGWLANRPAWTTLKFAPTKNPPIGGVGFMQQPSRKHQAEAGTSLPRRPSLAQLPGSGRPELPFHAIPKSTASECRARQPAPAGSREWKWLVRVLSYAWANIRPVLFLCQ